MNSLTQFRKISILPLLIALSLHSACLSRRRELHRHRLHLVRNEGNVEAVNVAVQIVPAGAARRIDADQPANCPVVTCP